MNVQFMPVAEYVFNMQRQLGATAAAFYVLQNGRVAHESYSGRHDSDDQSRCVDAYTQFNVGSIRKSYMALALSLLIEQGKIESIDDEVSRYLIGMPSIFRGVTLRHIITHTHGLVEKVGSIVREFPVGEGWTYCNVGIDLLYRIISLLTNMSLSDYITKTVLEPYSLLETGWRSAPNEHLIYNYYTQDNNWVGPNDSVLGDQSNLFVSARDLGKWGHVHLRQGVALDGRQVLPRSVFERVTSLHTPKTVAVHEPRNGFIWWLQHSTPLNQLGEKLPTGSYQLLGITGCAVLVIPYYDVVAVRMYNQLFNPSDYDYLKDIRTFGNMLNEVLN